MAEQTPVTPVSVSTVENETGVPTARGATTPKAARATKAQKAAGGAATPAPVVQSPDPADAPYRRVYLSYSSKLTRFVDSQTHLVVTKDPQIVEAARVGHACLCELAVVIEPVTEPA